ncbi:hypothetical protein CR513_25963, partial [Mucuna pruriens]
MYMLFSCYHKYWCNHVFSCYLRYNVPMNNLSKSFNNTILLAIEKFIITMFEWITYVMGRFVTLREKCFKYLSSVMPKLRRRLDRKVEKSGNWLATWVENLKFSSPYRYVVIAITYNKEDVKMYIHKFYKRETYEVPPGRPRKLRRGELDEDVSHSKLTRKHAYKKYSKYNQYGHNTRAPKKINYG